MLTVMLSAVPPAPQVKSKEPVSNPRPAKVVLLQVAVELIAVPETYPLGKLRVVVLLMPKIGPVPESAVTKLELEPIEGEVLKLTE